MKSLGKKVMANFLARMVHMNVARGYYTWVDTTNLWNKKRRLLKKSLVYWCKSSTASAFRKWATTHYKKIEFKLKADLSIANQDHHQTIATAKQEK